MLYLIVKSTVRVIKHLRMKPGTGRSRTDRHRILQIPTVYRNYRKIRKRENYSGKRAEPGSESGELFSRPNPRLPDFNGKNPDGIPVFAGAQPNSPLVRNSGPRMSRFMSTSLASFITYLRASADSKGEVGLMLAECGSVVCSVLQCLCALLLLAACLP